MENRDNFPLSVPSKSFKQYSLDAWHNSANPTFHFSHHLSKEKNPNPIKTEKPIPRKFKFDIFIN
jgi:hypothetical protein